MVAENTLKITKGSSNYRQKMLLGERPWLMLLLR